MNFSFIYLLLGTLLSAGAYAASSSYRLAEQQDIDSTENLKADFQSPLVKKVLETLMTQREDENVAAFLQAIHEFQSMEVTDQSLIQSEVDREMNEMRVVMAAFQSLPEEVRIQIAQKYQKYLIFIIPLVLIVLLFLCCCRRR